jgi:hypothetical protein
MGCRRTESHSIKHRNKYIDTIESKQFKIVKKARPDLEATSAIPRIELGLRDSKSRVLTTTLYDPDNGYYCARVCTTQAE